MFNQPIYAFMMRNLNKRVRIIGPKTIGQSGIIISNKQNSAIQFESSLERDFVYLLEFDDDVECYIDQPLTIDYHDVRGLSRRYTPDFLVRYYESERQDELIEIKYHKDLLENHFLWKEKFSATDNYCKQNNLIFKIKTEKEIRDGNTIYLKNIIFILGYTRNLDKIYDDSLLNAIGSDSSIILDKLVQIGKSKIFELLEHLSNDESRRSEYLYIIWVLIGKKIVGCDLNSELSTKSFIWI